MSDQRFWLGLAEDSARELRDAADHFALLASKPPSLRSLIEAWEAVDRANRTLADAFWPVLFPPSTNIEEATV